MGGEDKLFYTPTCSNSLYIDTRLHPGLCMHSYKYICMHAYTRVHMGLQLSIYLHCAFKNFIGIISLSSHN